VQAGVQALAAERARQVPGIAEKEPTALCQTRNHALVHVERRCPSDILHRDVSGDAPTDPGRDDLGRARARQMRQLGVVEVADEREPAIVR
jgi:hypothetical protein